MNLTHDTSQLAVNFIRLASLELRFAKEKKYLNVVGLYCKLLGLAPLPDPKNVQPFYSYKLGQDDQAMELRFVLKDDGSITKKNRTIMYWEVADATIVTVNEILCNLPDYSSFEPVTDSPNSFKTDSQRAVVQDPSGNFIGLIGNPPFPFM
jgi:hypothetical protein